MAEEMLEKFWNSGVMPITMNTVMNSRFTFYFSRPGQLLFETTI
ncbi:MAG: hypothetical protein ACLUD4_00985 [Thomasclavelia spiroformis]